MMKTESIVVTARSPVTCEKAEDMQEPDNDISTFCNSSSIGSNTLDMRMHVMRERFKNLALLDDNETHSDASSPLTSK